MNRIYFDTNVFSNLQSNTDETFLKLNEVLKLYRHNLSFIFSHAHIRDKIKADNRKIDYFKFMETFVGDNHISYDAIKMNTTFYLATPMMVFKRENPESESYSSLKENEYWQSYEKTLSNTPFSLNLRSVIDTPESEAILSKLFPLNKENPTMLDFANHLFSFSDEMRNNNKTYSDLRNYIYQNLNQGKYDLHNTKIDFNEAFKDGLHKKTFVDYVKSTLAQYGEDIPYYNFYVQSYSLLDMYGISKDKINLKNGQDNILNDAVHSYYATYCDYLVSDDKRLIEKSKALYNMYKIQTKVVTSTEFFNVVQEIGINTTRNHSDFFSSILESIKKPSASNTIQQSDGSWIIEIDLIKHCFNFFDQLILLVLPDDNVTIFLTKKNSNLFHHPTFREQEEIIRKCVDCFGSDVQGLKYFDFDTETEQLKKHKWTGRTWFFDPFVLYLHINKTARQFCLQIDILSS